MRYAVLDEERKIVNTVEAEPELAVEFGAHYLGDAPLSIGDTYPETDLEPPHEPTTEEKVAALSAENEALTAKCAKLETVAAALADQQSFYEDCIAEMAEVVYA